MSMSMSLSLFCDLQFFLSSQQPASQDKGDLNGHSSRIAHRRSSTGRSVLFVFGSGYMQPRPGSILACGLLRRLWSDSRCETLSWSCVFGY
ncbi:hypothetical protein BJX70DRAFT_375121 [Aspergillus crustosus]